MIHSTTRIVAAAFAWLALSVLSVASVCADVIPFEEGETGRSIDGTFTAAPGELIGNVQIVEYQGPYRANVDADPVDHAVRQAISQSYYAVQPDDYDFLVVFADFPVDFGGFSGFHFQVANHVEGIGRPLHAGAPAFGSQGRLLGYIDMGDRLRLPMLPGGHDHDALLDTLMHEIMHQWGVYVRYRDDNGQANDSLLGQHGSHWSFFADTDASVMYGARWQEQGAGRFRVIGIRERYSPLDLYLAGFLPAEQVPPIRLIRSFQGSPADLPRLGTVIDGQPELIGVERIVAEEGPRLPSYAQARRDYRAGLMLLVRPGQPPRPEMLGRLEMLRMQAQTRFTALTLGRGVLNIGRARPTPGGEAGAPATIGSDLPLRPDADLDLAGNWLLSRQFAAGHWQDKPSTRTLDTALAAAALRSIGDTDAAVASAATWLRGARRTTVEEQAQLLRSRLLPADDAALVAGALADGYLLDRGWGLNGGFEASTVDTAIAVDALFSHIALAPGGFPSDALANWRDAVPAQARGDCWTLHAGDGRCHLLASARALRALGAAGFVHADLEPAVERLFAWQHPDHGFGEQGSGSSEAETAEALLALNAIGAPRDLRLLRAELYLAARQRSDGSWQGSVATTAKVIEVLSSAARPDLRVRSAAVEAESTVYPGDRVGLRLGIDNGGAVAAPASRLQVAYVNEGDEQIAGIIDAFATLPALQPLQREDLVGDWDTTGLPPGSYRIDIVLDADGEVDEVDESNNRAELRVVLAAPPSQPDLDIEPGTAVLAPNVVVQVPAEATLTATIRNRGAVAAAAVRVRASLLRGTQAIPLAETVLPELPPMSVAPVELALTIAHVDATEILLEVDPDNAVPEANEANNSLRLRLYREATVDLAVFESDLVLTPSSPVVGVDAALSVTVRNRGTEIAPPSRVLIEAEHQGVRLTIVDQLVQIPANAVRRLEFAWRPLAVGPHRLHVTLDPENLVAEIDETNNAAWLDADVAASTLPNLIVTSSDLVLLPDPPEQGQPLIVQALVRNSGTVDAAPFKIGVYLGDPSDSGERFALLDVVEGLVAGESYPAQAILPSLERTREIVVAVRVDDEDELVETSEADNLAMLVRPVLRLPDLAVREGDVRLEPSRPVPGEVNLVRVRVVNNGQQSVADALVDIHLGQPEQGGVMLAPSHLVPLLPANGSAEHVFEWIPTGDEPDTRIVVRVDPSDAVREGDEGNNRAVIDFELLDLDFFLTEPVFSPNGDGIKDSTRIVARLETPTTTVIRIETGWGEEVRRFEGGELVDAATFTIDWDGRDQNGRLVLDADYQVHIEMADGTVIRTLRAVVDTNRLPVLLAAGTPYEHVTPLSCSAIRHGSDVRYHPDSRTYFAIGSTDDDPSRRGIHLFDMDGAAPKAIVPIDSLLHDGETWVPSRLLDIAGSHLYFTALAAGASSRERMFRVPLVGGASQVIGPEGYHGDDLALVGVTAGGDVLRVHREIGNPKRRIEVLRAPTYESPEILSGEWSVEHPQASSHLLTSDYLLIRGHETDGWDDYSDWLKIDLHAPQAPVAIAPSLEQWAIDPRHEILYIASTAQPGGEPPSLLEVDPASGAAVPIVIPGNGERFAITLNPGNGDLMLFDVRTLSAHRRDSALGSWQSMDISSEIRGLFGASAGGGSREYINNFRWSDSGQILLYDFVNNMESLASHNGRPSAKAEGGFGEATLAMRVDLWSPPIAIRSSFEGMHSPPVDEQLAQEANGVDTYGSAFSLLPGEPQALFSVYAYGGGDAEFGVLPLRGWIGGRLAPERGLGVHSWNQTGTRLLAGRAGPWGTPCEEAGYFSVQSLMNLTALPRVEYSGVLRALAIEATTSDLNFDRYEIEFRRSETGSAWQPVFSGRDAVVDEIIGFWAPPSPGPYEIRLSAFDLAGNVERKQVPLLWFDEARLGTVRLTEKYFSPNNDGVLDTTSVFFRVYLPVEVDVRVEHESGSLVRRTSLQFASVPDELQTWVWDGRNDLGQVVADGRYRIIVDGRALDVVVDTTPPVARFTAGSFRPSGGPTGMTAFIEDPLLSSQAIERAPALQPDDWRYFDQFLYRYSSDYRCFAMKTRVDNCGRMLSYEQIKSHRWRIVASDRAGNAVVVPLQIEPDLILGRELVYTSAGQRGPGFRVEPQSTALPFRWRLDDVPERQESVERLYPLDTDRIAYLVADTTQQGNQPIGLWYVERDDALGCGDLGGLNWRPLPFEEFSATQALTRLPPSTHDVVQSHLPLWRLIVVDEGLFLDRTDYLVQLVRPGELPGSSCELAVTRKVVIKQDGLVAEASGYWLRLAGADGGSSVRAMVDRARMEAGPDVSLKLQSLFAEAGWQLLDASIVWRYCAQNDERFVDILNSGSPSLDDGLMTFDASSADYEALPYSARYRSPILAVRARHRVSGAAVQYQFEEDERDCASPPFLCETTGATGVVMRDGTIPKIPGRHDYRVVLVDQAGAPGNVLAAGSLAPESPLPVDIRHLDAGMYPIEVERYDVSDASWKHVDRHVLHVDRTPPEIIDSFVGSSPNGRVCLSSLPDEIERGVVAQDNAYITRSSILGLDSGIAQPVCGPSGSFGLCSLPIRKPTSDGPFSSSWRWVVKDCELETVGPAHAIAMDVDAAVRTDRARLNGAHELSFYGFGTDTPGIAGERWFPKFSASPEIALQGEFSLRVYERVDFSVDVVPVIGYRGLAEGWDIEGEPVATLLQGTAEPSLLEWTWDGRGDGGDVLPDRVYAVRVRMTDECGNVGMCSTSNPDTGCESILRNPLLLPIRVDNTPPGLAVISPQDDIIVDVLHEVSGRVFDVNEGWLRTYVRKAVADEPWQALGGEHEILDWIDPGEDSVWAVWNTSELDPGQYEVRVVATDRLGHVSERIIPVQLPARQPVLVDAAVQPALFSPNDDNLVDVAALSLTLVRAADLSVAVHRRADGGLVRVLATNQPVGTGTHGLVWDGRSANGTVVSDGVYEFRITVSDAGDPGNVQGAALVVETDTAAPALSLHSPTGSFAKGDETLILMIDERNPKLYQAQIQPSIGPGTWSGEGAGAQSLASLADAAEGEYRLNVHAVDRAENASTVQFEFTIDRTPPVAELLTPAADSHVGTVGGPVAVTGRAADAHFASYRLELRPEDGGAAIVLVQSETALAGEHLFDWLPEQPDGRYLLTLVVTDKAGWESVAQVPVVVDNTPPEVVIDQPEDDTFVAPPVRVEGTAADANLRHYRIDLAAAGEGTPHWSLLHEGTESVHDDLLAELTALPPEGRFRLRVSAVDHAGNRAEQAVTVDIDTVPPTTPLQLTAQRLGNDGARLDWQPVDAPDLAGYRLYRDGMALADVASDTTRHDDLAVPDGERVYTVTALDHAGNESAPSNEARLRIDSTPPETRLLRPVEGERVRGDVEIWGTAHSDDDFARFRIDATPAGGSAIELAQGAVPLRNERLTTWDTRALDEEILVRIELHAEDTSGNAASDSVEVLVDNQPPAAPVGLVAVVENTVDVRLDWQPNVEADLVGYLVYRGGLLLNGDPLSDPREIAIAEVTWLDEGVADGQHDYRVVAVDLAGNISEPSDPASVSFEGQPPSVEFERPLEGHAFEHSVLVRVRSEHQDIVQVLFEQRAIDGDDWTAIGAPVTTLPYQITFTPGALPYGDYQIRATATDSENLTDPVPPIRLVRYRDLTAPDAITGLAALVDGGDVQLSWQPVVADDLAGYRIARRAIAGGDNEIVADVAAPDTAYLDAGRDDDRYEYTVFAFDTSDNLSAGRMVPARVHTPRADYPYTPTEDAQTTVCGTAEVPGQMQVEHEVDGDVQSLPVGATDDEGAFCVEAVVLLPGTNHLRLRVLDADGHRSKPAELVLRHGAAPAVPDGVTIDVDGHEAALAWQANVEPDVIGYRVFRDDVAVQPDAETAETGVGYFGYGDDSSGYPANELFDGDPETYAWFYLGDAEAIWVEQTYADPLLLAGVDIDLQSDGSLWRPVLATLYGWSGEAWIRLGEAQASQPGTLTLRPARPYRSDALRLTLGAVDVGLSLQLHDIRVIERPLHPDTQLVETLPDGAHFYRVSAINAFGFESERSEPVEARIGDWQPPEPVVLSADVDGADVQLGWTQSISDDVDAYLLMRDDTLLVEVPADDPRSHGDLGLANGSYHYHVLVRDLTGHLSTPSNVVEVAIDQAITVAAPVGLAVSMVEGGGALDLAWQPGDGAAPAGYRVFRSEVAGGPFQPIADVAVTAHRDTGLVNGRRYHYVVRALDAPGNLSPASNEASGVPHLSPAQAVTYLLHPGLGGSTVELAGNATVVSGWAEPGAQVTVLRDGQPMATVQAVVWSEDDVLPEYGYFVASPDGRHLLRFNYGNQRVELLRRGDGTMVADFPWCEFADWLDAETLLLCESVGGGTHLIRHSIVSQQRVTLLQASHIYEVGLSPDRGTALVDAQRMIDDQWLEGIWLVDLATGTWIAVDSDALDSPYLPSPAWSADGSRFAFVTHDGQLAIGDVAAAQIQVPDIVADGEVAFLRDTPALLVGGDIGAGLGIHRIDLATLEVERLPLEAGDQTRVGLSADGSRLLYLLDDAELVIRHWPSLDLVERRPLPGGDVWPVWLANGEVQLSHWLGDRIIAPAGLFLTEPVQLPTGRNQLAAYAQRPGGGAGGLSESVEVIVPSPHRPDLAIPGGDLRVVPAVTPVGEGSQLLARVRNLGPAPAPSSLLRIMVNAPNGQLVHAVERNVPAIAASAFAEIAVAVPATTQPGEYRITAIADPANLVVEVNEGNNQSVVVLLAARDDQPELALDLSHSSLAPGERLTGSAAAIAVVTPFHGRLAVRVLDQQGYLVADLGDIAVQLAGPGQRVELPVDWSSAQVFAGQYRVQARLRDLSGVLVRETERLVTVRSEAIVVMSVQPDQPEVPAGATLTGDIGIDYLAGNRLLIDVALHLRLLDESGNERASQQHAIGSLLPGDGVVRGYGFAGAGLAPGLYQVVAELRESTLLTQAAASVRALPAGGGAGLVGTLALPTHAVPLGDALAIGYAVENRGDDDLLALPLHIQLRPADLGAPVAQASVQIDLPAGQTWQGSLPVPAAALRQGQYLVTLDRTDTVPAQRLALGSFGTIDATPPTVVIHAPSDGTMTTGAFDVDVRAFDSHSAVAAARIRVNDGAWLGLGQGIQAPGQYLRHLSGLADGAVVLQAMAEDAAGNQALSEPVTVIVDATAPLIVIDGVEHHAIYNHVVVPTVEISDANLAGSHVVLNGEVFVSGTPVAVEGAHRLFVTAVDHAGNRGNVEVAFDIDLTPPAVVFTHPDDGATVGTAQIDVLGLTEALAEVTLSIGGQSFQTTAAQDGAFAFDGVPLAIGENLLSAHAVDRAGNVGAASGLTVHRIEGGVGTVEGALTLDAATVVHGQPIAGSRTLSLDGTVPLDGLPVRLRLLRAADGTEVAVQSGTVDLAPGTPDVAPFAFETVALPAQGYRISLEVELDAGGGTPAWVQLDQAKVAVIDVDAPQVQLLQPAPGAVVGSPFAVLATAQDALSGLDVVEAQLDDGPWLPLAALADPVDGFGGDLAGADGAHVVRVRAADGAGNVGYSADHAIAIDMLPPVITVTGIKDGALLNQSVVPVIEVDDAHLDVVEILLDGQPFASGTQVDDEGAHVLTVHAADVLGQSSSATIAFTLDFTAPDVAILDPVDGAQVTAPQVTVLVQTEPHVALHLQAGAYQAQLMADADGLATFAAVPLVLGENIITAWAVDGAGNVGASTGITVLRVQPGDAKLAGRIEDLPDVVAPDDPVAGTWHIANTGDADSGPMQVRLRLRADGATLAEELWMREIAVGQTDSAPFLFAAADWPAGVLTVELHARPQSDTPLPLPWLLLAAEIVPVDDGQTAQLHWLQPEPDSTVPERFTVAVRLSGAPAAPSLVELRVDEGDWQPMAAGTDAGTYELALRLRQEWWHRFHVRAWNATDLLAELEPVRLCVDLGRIFAHDFERHDRLFRNGFDPGPCPSPPPDTAAEPEPPPPGGKRFAADMIDARRFSIADVLKRLARGGV